MSTLLQKELAQNIVKNAKASKKKTKTQLLVSVGYSALTAGAKQKEILESKGVLEELENLGFDSESARKVVKNILTRGKEENKLKAADMIFKVIGEYAPEKRINVNVTPIYGGHSTRSIQGHNLDAQDIPTNKED